jgi:hypothetical protein
MKAARRGLVTAGTLTMGYAIVGARTDRNLHPGGVLIFLAAVLAGHDAVLLPLIIAIGALIGRLVPASARSVAIASASRSASRSAIWLKPPPAARPRRHRRRVTRRW